MNPFESSFVTKSLECPVCKEILSDPRVLPCGHAFCGGLANDCLETLKVENGNNSSSPLMCSLKCALCNVTHRININSLPPIYGIRDFLELAKSHIKKPDSSSELSNNTCSIHCKFDLEFVCGKCKIEVCKLCFEAEHSWHPIKLKSAVDQERFCEVFEKLNLSQIKEKCTQYLAMVTSIHSDCSQTVSEALDIQQSLNEMLGSVNNLIENEAMIELACDEKLFRYSDPLCSQVLKVASSYENIYKNVECLLRKMTPSVDEKQNEKCFKTCLSLSKIDCFLLLAFCLSVLFDCYLRYV